MWKKFFISLLFCFFLLGAGAPAMGQIQPFHDEELKKFMVDMPKLMNWMLEKGTRYENYDYVAGFRRGKYGAFMDEILEVLGWKDPERFFYIFEHITLGLAAIEAETTHSELETTLKEQRKMILEDPDIPEDQKKQLVSDLQASLGLLVEAYKELVVNRQEMALIQIHEDELNEAFAKLETAEVDTASADELRKMVKAERDRKIAEELARQQAEKEAAEKGEDEEKK